MNSPTANAFTFHEEYSRDYRNFLATALEESSKLGFIRDPLISEKNSVSDDALKQVIHLLNDFSEHLDSVCIGYWGNLCQTLSTHIFAYLNVRGIPANIVLGNVFIQENDGFGTTLESLKSEYLSKVPLSGHQALHAWVSIGDDTVIDAALPPRLVKDYKAPKHVEDMIFIGRASLFAKGYYVRYQPLLLGSEFFAKTNPPDPMDLLKAYRSLMR